MIGDTDLAVAKLYNMLSSDEAGASEGRTAATNATVRSVFIIGPDKKIKLMLTTYPMTTQGPDVIITAAVSNDEAALLFPGFKTIESYLRTTQQPG